MLIVALSGWKGSGKDSVAKFMVEEHGFKRIAFADVLKDMVAETYKIPRSYMDDIQYKESALLNMPVRPVDKFSKMITEFMHKEFAPVDGSLYWSPRALCILEGSIKRSADPDYWVSRALSKANDPHGKYVITDVRYRSELTKLEELVSQSKSKDELITVRVKRFDDSPSTDPSERDLDNTAMDVVIPNYNSLDHLKSKVRMFNSYLESDNA